MKKTMKKISSKIDVYKFGYYLIVIFLMLYLLWVPKFRVVGEYINNNTEYVLEGPLPIDKYVDTLKIFDDGTFESKTWGNGTYLVKGNFLSPRLRISYTYEFGKAGAEFIIQKPVIGNLRIWLDQDLGFYFKKI